jgi:class 3 adenylate cyclase
VDFEQVLKEVVWRLVTEGRISYRRIKLSFALDDDGLEELRRELIDLKRLAADVDGELLVWGPDGRAARREPMALPQPLPALRHAEKPIALAAERDLPAVAPAAIAAAPDAERRQLTVMFCDLVGSTALSTGMDPEDLRDVITSFQNRCSAAIRRYDGFVAKFMGDGILVYFGYPRAHEDAAERSVRAGLDIVDAMAELNAGVRRPPGVELAARIGIATGPVIVGDQIGEGTAQETAVGIPANRIISRNAAQYPKSRRRTYCPQLHVCNAGVRRLESEVAQAFAISRVRLPRVAELPPGIYFESIGHKQRTRVMRYGPDSRFQRRSLHQRLKSETMPLVHPRSGESRVT